MKNLLASSLKFEKEVLERKQSPYFRTAKVYFSLIPLLAWGKKYQESSKHLLFGLTAAMEGSIKGEGALGIFNPDYEQASRLIARGLLLESNERDEGLMMKERLFSRLIMGGIAALIGLIDRAAKGAEERTNEASSLYFITLLLRMIVASDLLEQTMKTVAESLETSPRLTQGALESVALLALTVAFLPKGGEAKETFFEALKEPLERDFNRLESLLIEGKHNEKSIAPLLLFLKEGKVLLNERNYERFLKELSTLLKAYGLSEEKLKEDFQTMKSLFGLLEAQVDKASIATENTISFVG
jgi:hypothetical protein